MLKKFENRKVVGTSIIVTNAGDGLSEALKGEPRELHHGQAVVLVMDATVAKVRHDPSKDDETDLVRVHILRAGTATIVDADQAGDIEALLADQKEKNALRREAEDGVQRLPVEDELDDLTEAEKALQDKMRV